MSHEVYALLSSLYKTSKVILMGEGARGVSWNFFGMDCPVVQFTWKLRDGYCYEQNNFLWIYFLMTLCKLKCYF